MRSQVLRSLVESPLLLENGLGLAFDLIDVTPRLEQLEQLVERVFDFFLMLASFAELAFVSGFRRLSIGGGCFIFLAGLGQARLDLIQVLASQAAQLARYGFPS